MPHAPEWSIKTQADIKFNRLRHEVCEDFPAPGQIFSSRSL
jgi:hypothetical protein